MVSSNIEVFVCTFPGFIISLFTSVGVPCTASNGRGNSTVLCAEGLDCCRRETESELPFAQCCPRGKTCGPYHAGLAVFFCLKNRKTD